MKKMLLAVLALVLVGSFAAAARADLEGSAVASVHLRVTANISVTPQSPIVDAGSLQIGELIVNIPFMVHGNTEAVTLWVDATNLYKGDIPTDPTVAFIPLQIAPGIVITPDRASVLGGGSNVAVLPSSPNATIGAFPAYETSRITFESAENGSFSHPVIVTVQWTLSDNQQPVGDYAGRVQLNAMVVGNSGVPSGI
jgi:hypothetical protein